MICSYKSIVDVCTETGKHNPFPAFWDRIMRAVIMGSGLNEKSLRILYHSMAGEAHNNNDQSYPKCAHFTKVPVTPVTTEDMLD
ncbi:hypothetical protein TNCT_300021 [Trichonephila clavata]|uniref:Uncharacterized protein n=1 Tax=Trichonephila clavata TaxID=2740835 RepID=A0A8X6KCT8_TRICU|nr:hypothetical protein TNCT_300021 [Trichonephila clavata]